MSSERRGMRPTVRRGSRNADPSRLRDTGSDDVVALLASARVDVPSRKGPGKTLAVLGVSTAVMGAAGEATAAVGIGKWIGFAKWMGLATLGIAAVGFGVSSFGSAPMEVSASVASPGPIEQASPGPVEQASPADGVVPTNDAVRPEHAVPTATADAAEVAVPAKAVVSTEKSSDSGQTNQATQIAKFELMGDQGSAPAAPAVIAGPAEIPDAAETSDAPIPEGALGLAEEVASLDQAKAVLENGGAKQALAHLDAHQKSFDGGVLGPESSLLRLEALVAADRNVEAVAVGYAFLMDHGGSPHVPRVRTLIDRAEEKVEE